MINRRIYSLYAPITAVMPVFFLLLLTAHVWAAPNPIHKLDSQLRLLAGEGHTTLARPMSVAPDDQVPGMLIQRDGMVLVEARLRQPAEAFRSQLEWAGLTITGMFEGLVSGWIAPDRLAALATLEIVSTVFPVYPPITNSMPIQGEGVPALWADFVHNEMGFDGGGVKVGILSDSFASISNATPYYEFIDGATYVLGTDSQLAGEIPERVQIILDMELDAGSDEGRAMAEIIHEMAPGAELAYHTAFLGKALFAQGIIALAQAGCDVIVDDVIYLTLPVYQEGEISRAITTVVNEYDSVYFSATGNSANETIEMMYRDIDPGRNDDYTQKFPSGNDLHSWGLGFPNPSPFLRIGVNANNFVRIALKWENPYSGMLGPGASTDYDLYILDKDEWSHRNIVAVSDNYQGTAESPQGDPYEFLYFFNDSNQPKDYYIAINKLRGEAVPFRLQFFHRGDLVFTPRIRAQDIPNIFGHEIAEHAISVAAVNVVELREGGTAQGDPRRISPAWYTSKGGPFRILYSPSGETLEEPIIRMKPDIASVDGSANSFFGRPNTLNGEKVFRFYGTSAAAPHAAAIAALMRQANPQLTVSDIRRLMIHTAIDVHDEGFDPYTGHGMVYADLAVEAALNPPPPVTGELPRNAVIVTDNLASWADLSNNVAYASPNYRALVIRWNIQEANIRDFHLYVSVNGGAPNYLGRSGDGSASTFEWSVGAERYIAPGFADGPQFGDTYRFHIYAICEGQPPLGPFRTLGPVQFVERH